MATCFESVSAGLHIKKLKSYPRGRDLIAMALIINTKMLLKSRKREEVTHDLDVICTHDDRERNEH